MDRLGRDPPGAPWRKELGTAIEAALAFVCVLTPDWLQSQECQLEYQRAVTLGKRIIPVLAVETSPPDELAALNWIDARFVSTERVVELLLVAIETDPEAVRAHTYWLSRAVRWENEGEERSLLLRGAELRNAEEWLAHAGADPSPIPLQRRYIEAGRADEGRRARRRTIAITAAVVICLGLAAIAVIQLEATGTSRRQSESRALASAALNQLNIDPQRALLLAQAAWKTSQTTQALNALEVAVAASRVRLTYRGLAGAAHSMGWGPGDRVVVATGGDGEVRAWNAADARPLGAIAAGQGDVTEFAADRAGDVGVAGTTGGSAVIWRISPQSQAISTVARLAADDASAVTISADGHSVVLGRRDGGVSLWHLPDLARQTLRPPGSARSECVAVSPDGRTVLSGNSDGTATLWPSGGHPRTIASYRTPVVTCALDSAGDVALTSSEAGPGTVLDTSGGHGVLLRVNHVYGAALSPDGRSVGTDDIDGGVELYDVLSGSHVTLRRNGSAETWLGFNGDGSELAAGGADGITHVWRTSGRASPVADLRGATGLVQGAAFSHDGRLLVTGDGTSGVIKWALPVPPLALAVQRTGSQSATTSSVALFCHGRGGGDGERIGVERKHRHRADGVSGRGLLHRSRTRDREAGGAGVREQRPRRRCRDQPGRRTGRGRVRERACLALASRRSGPAPWAPGQPPARRSGGVFPGRAAAGGVGPRRGGAYRRCLGRAGPCRAAARRQGRLRRCLLGGQGCRHRRCEWKAVAVGPQRALRAHACRSP